MTSQQTFSFWDEAPGSLQTRLLERLDPAMALAFYYEGRVDLQELVNTHLLPKIPTTIALKLHSLQGSTINQGTKTRTLLEILGAASEVDRDADLLALQKVASEEHTHKLVEEAVRVFRGKFRSLRNWAGGSALLPITHKPPGTYSNFYNCIRACDAKFIESGAKRHLKIVFRLDSSSETLRIGNKDIYLPSGTQLLAGHNAIYLTGCRHVDTYNYPGEILPCCVCVRPDGSASLLGEDGRKLADFLACWDEDALMTAGVIGQACSKCMWCDRELTDAKSVRSHAGPVCSRRYRDVLSEFTRQRYPRLLTRTLGGAAGPVRGVDMPIRSHCTVCLPPKPTAEGGQMTALKIPHAVVRASPFLQGFMEDFISLPEEFTALLLTHHTAYPESFEDIATMLERPSWFPPELDRIEKALLTSHALSMPSEVTALLESMYVNMMNGPSKWKTVLPETVVNGFATKAAGIAQSTPTPFRVAKRTRTFNAHLEVIDAVRKKDYERLTTLITAEQATMDPPQNLTKAQKSQVFESGGGISFVWAALEKASDHRLLKLAFELGLSMENGGEGVFDTLSSRSLDFYHLFLAQGADPEKPLCTALRESSFETVEGIVKTAGIRQMHFSDLTYTLLKRTDSEGPVIFCWLIDQNILSSSIALLAEVLGMVKDEQFVREAILKIFSRKKEKISGDLPLKIAISKGNYEAFFWLLETFPENASYFDAELLRCAISGLVEKYRYGPREPANTLLTRVLDAYKGDFCTKHMFFDAHILRILRAKSYVFTANDIATLFQHVSDFIRKENVSLFSEILHLAHESCQSLEVLVNETLVQTLDMKYLDYDKRKMMSKCFHYGGPEEDLLFKFLNRMAHGLVDVFGARVFQPMMHQSSSVSNSYNTIWKNIESKIMH